MKISAIPGSKIITILSFLGKIWEED